MESVSKPQVGVWIKLYGDECMTHRKKRGSIILLVAVFFLIGVLTTGLLTYFSERQLSTSSVKRQMEQWAAEISAEVKEAVTEYPGHQWLVRYWYAHAQELDIEYDASFDLPSETAQKCAIFAQRHPELQLRYLNTACTYLRGRTSSLPPPLTPGQSGRSFPEQHILPHLFPAS